MAIEQATKTGASKDTISAAWNKYNATVTAILTEHASTGAHGAITATSLATTTITALTSLTPAGNLDIGAYSFRAQNLIADALTSGRVVLTTTNGQLTSDSDITFSDDTLTVTKLNALTLAAAATGFTIAGGTTSKTLTLDANLVASYLANITAAEADQIEAIGATTISADQWAWLGGYDINSMAKAYLSANQDGLVHLTWTKVLLNVEAYDPGSNFDVANNRYVAPVTGYYQVNANGGFTNVVADKRYLVSILVNGVFYATTAIHAAIATNVYGTISDLVYLVAGQFIELFARSDSGNNTVNLIGGEITFNYLSIFFVSS